MAFKIRSSGSGFLPHGENAWGLSSKPDYLFELATYVWQPHVQRGHMKESCRSNPYRQTYAHCISSAWPTTRNVEISGNVATLCTARREFGYPIAAALRCSFPVDRHVIGASRNLAMVVTGRAFLKSTERLEVFSRRLSRSGTQRTFSSAHSIGSAVRSWLAHGAT